MTLEQLGINQQKIRLLQRGIKILEGSGYREENWSNNVMSYKKTNKNKYQTSTIEFDDCQKIVRTQSTEYGVVKSKQLTMKQLEAIVCICIGKG